MIKVTPEGRDGLWIADKDSVVEFLDGYEHDEIHNLMPAGVVQLGADWEKVKVIEKVKDAERIAIATGSSYRSNLRHALAVIVDNELLLFDIGEITEDGLEMTNDK